MQTPPHAPNCSGFAFNIAMVEGSVAGTHSGHDFETHADREDSKLAERKWSPTQTLASCSSRAARPTEAVELTLHLPVWTTAVVSRRLRGVQHQSSLLLPLPRPPFLARETVDCSSHFTEDGPNPKMRHVSPSTRCWAIRSLGLPTKFFFSTQTSAQSGGKDQVATRSWCGSIERSLFAGFVSPRTLIRRHALHPGVVLLGADHCVQAFWQGSLPPPPPHPPL